VRVTLESTTKIVRLIVDGREVPARIWEGHTEAGIACHAYITRIAVDPNDDAAEFQRELLEQRKPTPAIEAIPTRLII
jgi:hypothetical protein